MGATYNHFVPPIPRLQDACGQPIGPSSMNRGLERPCHGPCLQGDSVSVLRCAACRGRQSAGGCATEDSAPQPGPLARRIPAHQHAGSPYQLGPPLLRPVSPCCSAFGVPLGCAVPKVSLLAPPLGGELLIHLVSLGMALASLSGACKCAFLRCQTGKICLISCN